MAIARSRRPALRRRRVTGVIIDASAIVAILREEPSAERCLDLIVRAAARRISAANLLETYLVIDGAREPEMSRKLDALLARVALTVEPVTEAHVVIARDAFRRYGKGSGHGARLNFGDCFAYALARDRDEPLLFVGSDFARTDIGQAA